MKRRQRTGKQMKCSRCGALFKVKPSHAGRRRFCSVACKSSTVISPINRFWKHVSPCPISGCWHWMGGRTSFGHGRFRVGKKSAGMIGPHVFSFKHFVGTVPESLCVLHRCDNPGCVNPDHLFVGDKADNARDAVSKGRWNMGFKRGYDARRNTEYTKQFLKNYKGPRYGKTQATNS